MTFSLIVNHKFRFIFIHIPKTGGTSVRSALSTLEGSDRSITAKTKHETPNEFQDRLKQSVRNSATTSNFEDYLWISFVRNPWDRFSSLHRYLLQGQKKKYQHVPQDLNTFVEVLMGPSPPEWSNTIRSLRPQSDYLPRLGSHFIGRYENINEDFQRISNIFGQKLDLVHHNSTLPNSASMSSESINSIAKFYSTDIERFDYEYRPSPLTKNTPAMEPNRSFWDRLTR